jgi:heterodisulfide reductase subunit A
LELEEHINRGDEKVMNARSLVMIQCVGCTEEDRNYCARVCCNVAVKNALKLKAINPELDIYILFRDMRTYGFAEDYYREAAERDVKFIRWEPDDKPRVDLATAEGKSVLRITVPDPVLGQRLELDADLLVLSAALVPSEGSREIARLFKAPLSPDGFFQEAHVKLRPVDFAAEGVYTCGTAHYPKNISETIAQAYGAAGRAVTLLAQDSVTASGAVCEVNEDECVSCGACIAACAYGAIEFRETPRGKKAYVNPILCTGDGLCNAKCPTHAIMLKHYTDEEVFCQIDAAAPAFDSNSADKGAK